MKSKCSRAGCQDSAIILIEWRNPKIHAADRVKLWSSCESHRGYLVDYLKTRGMYLGVRDFESSSD
ncbi:MAG: acetone carboxylase [Actinomycetota bacterium]|nr:acetone carboxylase [Actinomycetota bacterium]